MPLLSLGVRHNMKSIRNIFVALMACSSLTSVAYADRDGIFAFGPNYAVFTEFSKMGHQSLNVIPFIESKPLAVASSVEVETSSPALVTFNRTIFVNSGLKLYIYNLTDTWKLEHIHTFTIPEPTVRMIEGVYSRMYVSEQTLLVFGSQHNMKVDLRKPVAEWRLEPSNQPVDLKSSNWKFTKQGDWVRKRSTCLESNKSFYCLVYGVSHLFEQGGGLHYNDKFLVRRNTRGEVDSVFYLYTKLNTIH